MMSTTVAENYRVRFEREGMVYPIPVLAPERAAEYLACFSAVEAIVGEPLKRMENPVAHFSWAYQLATEPGVLAAVAGVLGPELIVTGSLVFCKPPRDPAFVAWHQDTVYSNLHLTPSVSAWIALRDSTSANGCMRVVPGSHRQGILPHQELRSPSNLLKRGEEILVQVDEAEAEDIVLRAGEMSLHHHSIVHGSRPNSSDGPRIGFIVRFATPAYDLSPQRGAFLRAQGSAPCGHLRMAEPPPGRELSEAVAVWRRAIQP